MPLNTITGIFAKSPIKPLEEHIKRVHSCCEELLPFFAAAPKGDWQEAATIRQSICQLEREADTIKRDIRLSLPSGILMPIDRGNLLELLRQQDKIANRAQDVQPEPGPQHCDLVGDRPAGRGRTGHRLLLRPAFPAGVIARTLRPLSNGAEAPSLA